MPLKSKLFAGDRRLQDCLVNDSAHVTLGTKGDFVSKIHTALLIIEGVSVNAGELKSQTYGPSTAAAVQRYKEKRKIINASYQHSADNIVGKMTIAKLDEEVLRAEARPIDPNVKPHIPSFT